MVMEGMLMELRTEARTTASDEAERMFNGQMGPKHEELDQLTIKLNMESRGRVQDLVEEREARMADVGVLRTEIRTLNAHLGGLHPAAEVEQRMERRLQEISTQVHDMRAMGMRLEGINSARTEIDQRMERKIMDLANQVQDAQVQGFGMPGGEDNRRLEQRVR